MHVVAPIEPKQKFIMEDVRPPLKFVEIKPPQPREVDDDWFVLLDVAAKVPGTLMFSSFSFFVAVAVKWNETNCVMTEKAILRGYSGYRG